MGASVPSMSVNSAAGPCRSNVSPAVLMFEQVGQSPHTPTCRGGVTDGMPSSYTSLRTG